MNPSIESTLADHGARLTTLEREQGKLADKLDTLRNLLIAVLGGVIAQLLASLLRH